MTDGAGLPPFAGAALVAVLLVSGLALSGWALAPALQGSTSARRHLGTHRLAVGSLVTVVLVGGLLSLPLAATISQGQLSAGTFAAAVVATDVPMVLFVYLRVVAPGAASWRDLGLRAIPARHLLKSVVLASIAALALTQAVGLLLQAVGIHSNQEEQFTFVQREPISGFFAVLLFGAVIAPVVEELFFRGYLYGLYRRRYSGWVAGAASSGLFSVLHVNPALMDPGQALGLLVGIVTLSAVFCFTYERTRSLYPGMVAHGLNNALALTLLYTRPVG